MVEGELRSLRTFTQHSYEAARPLPFGILRPKQVSYVAGVKIA
jgi:hypothetical protein